MVSIEPFSVAPTAIADLFVITMKQVTDDRGTIREFFRESAFASSALPSAGPWVQVNLTETARGAIRGLHGEETTKLVGVAAGEAFGAYVDARPASATFGTVETMPLTPGTQVLVPPGVCNGFQAVTEPMQYLYCFDTEWRPDMPGIGITPFDPGLSIDWPVPVDASDPRFVTAKDRDAPCLSDLGLSDLGLSDLGLSDLGRSELADPSA